MYPLVSWLLVNLNTLSSIINTKTSAEHHQDSREGAAGEEDDVKCQSYANPPLKSKLLGFGGWDWENLSYVANA